MTPDEFVVTCEACFPGSPADAYLQSRGHYASAKARLGWVGFEHPSWSELRNRVVMPVFHPYHGELCAITARAIADQTPKYWNTRGMPKLRLIYGLPRPRKLGQPVAIVEGQLDALALEHLGVPAYAVFGKNRISGWQIGLIRRITDHVILWPDLDVYGPVSESWAKSFKAYRIQTTLGPYANDPDAADPDSLCQRHADEVRTFYGQLAG